MIFNRKKIRIEKLLHSFGNIKDDSFEFESIVDYFQKKDNSDAFQVISDKTCNDLDFQELFMFLDRTSSKVGQQYLYNKLRTIPLNSKEIDKHEKLIEEFTKNSDFRVNIQLQLCKLNNKQSFYINTLFQDEHLKRPKWFFVVPILALTSLLTLIMSFFYNVLFFVLISVFIINAVIHYWNKYNLYEYLSSIPQLLRLNKVAKELFKYVLFNEIKNEVLNSTKVIDRVRNRMSFFKLQAKVETGSEIVTAAIIESFKILFLLEPLLLFDTIKQLDTKRKEIENVFSFVGEIDSLISIASLRYGLLEYCLPQIYNNGKSLKVIDVYHPLISNCVSNNIEIKNKSILLSGSNMSGKTSFIRAIGINAITGLTLNTCFAKQFCLPRVCIFSAIRISDDLLNDKSYYFEEVLTIKEMIDRSENKTTNLFLLDEIFKGTNTVERISAGKAVLSHLAKTDNLIFVSTHDIELADLLKDDYELYHFSEIVDNNTVDFDYKLKEGKLKTRNALRILEINDYPASIIKEAIDISKELDKVSMIHILGAVNT